jgi:hypothetical protein
VLDHPLTPTNEPTAKRLRYSTDSAEIECISSRVEAGVYQSPEALLADVDSATASLITDLQAGDPTSQDHNLANSAINQINLFKQSLSKVCRHIAEAGTHIKAEGDGQEDNLPRISEDTRWPSVLTLTSQTDRGPKQLYSGLQRQRRTDPREANEANGLPTKEQRNLDPGKFPNGISVTQVPPSTVADRAISAKQKRTFGDIFRPHRSLKALEPPRPSRNATRGSSLGWVNHEELAGAEKPAPAYKSDYRYASLPTGLWLHYNGAEASAATTTDSRRRQRDRALSFGEPRADPSIDENSEHGTAKTRALFQSAYSSFAPSSDNSAAVVPEKVRSHAWWNKVGQKRLHALLALQYPEADLDGKDVIFDTKIEVADDFGAAVASFEDGAIENPMEQHADENANPQEVDETLQEVSDLLQTLSSYQRIRNLSKMSGGPATPTPAESDVYEILRSNLAVLVNSLPPFAVAKLNGDQLEELNVSNNILVETKDHVGTMELDEYSLQRQRASMAATNPASARPSVSVGAGRPGNYNAQAVNYNQRSSYSNAPRTPYAASQPRPTAPYGSASGPPQAQAYSPARPAPISSQRQSHPSQQQYGSQGYSQTPNTTQFQRPSGALVNGYGPNYGNSTQQGTSQAYIQSRQGPSAYSFSVNQSPQKSITSPNPPVNGQQQYSQHSQQQQGRASPAMSYANDSQGVTSEQVRAQIQAQRQLSGTPQTPNVNGQYGPVVRSGTPGGGTPNGRPVVSASGGQ